MCNLQLFISIYIDIDIYIYISCAGRMIQYCVHGSLVCWNSPSVSIQLICPLVCISSSLKNGAVATLGVWINHVGSVHPHVCKPGQGALLMERLPVPLCLANLQGMCFSC